MCVTDRYYLNLIISDGVIQDYRAAIIVEGVESHVQVTSNVIPRHPAQSPTLSLSPVLAGS